jgi:hypothetical protein
MRVQAEQPNNTPQPETRRSFDPLASINLLRFDLETYGEILPDTRERVCNEQLSYFVEGINRASCTDFTLRRNDEGELTYFDQGRATPYKNLLFTGWRVAEAEAMADPRRKFLAEWAAHDWQVGMRLEALQPGETMLWYNAFPHRLRERYDDTFLKECGLQPERELGFIYYAEADENGSVRLRSQTVDRSDPEAFDAIDELLEYDPQADLETALRTYDGALAKREGGLFRAGRRDVDIMENAWDEMQRQKGLIQYMLEKLEDLARRQMMPEVRERETKLLLIGTWKEFKKRLTTPQLIYEVPAGQNEYQYYQSLVASSAREAIAQNDIPVGCGGALRLAAASETGVDPLEMPIQDMFKQIFGSESKADYKFDKRMYCVVCQAPPSNSEKKVAAKKMCGPCGICKGCDKKIRAKSRGAVAVAS